MHRAQHVEFLSSSGSVSTPAVGEILVKVESMSLDPIGWQVKIASQDSSVSNSTYRTVMGTAVAGAVCDVGQGVQSCCRGDRVCLRWTALDSNDYGSLREYVLISADIVVKIPPNFSFTQASKMAIGVSTGGPVAGTTFVAAITASNQSALVISGSTVGAQRSRTYWGSFVHRRFTANTTFVDIQRR